MGEFQGNSNKSDVIFTNKKILISLEVVWRYNIDCGEKKVNKHEIENISVLPLSCTAVSYGTIPFAS